MSQTSIEWTEHSINPFRARSLATGRIGHFCVPASPGCWPNCYSSNRQKRFGTYEFNILNRSKVELFLDESKLREVLRRRKPTKYFWCDMTDLADYPDDWIDRCFATMARTPQHIHQVLTKRSERMRDYLANPETEERIHRLAGRLVFSCPLVSVWVGVSVENQKYADGRIPHLIASEAAVRFVSYELALAAVNFGDHLQNLDWVIVGGESDQSRPARPCQLEWIRATLGETRRAGVACFVKQVGDNPYLNGRSFPVKAKKGGDPKEWPADLRIREFPTPRQSAHRSSMTVDVHVLE
jgi:protein gp37